MSFDLLIILHSYTVIFASETRCSLWLITDDSGVPAVSIFRINNRRHWAPRRPIGVQTITWKFVAPDISNWPRPYLEVNYVAKTNLVLLKATNLGPLRPTKLKKENLNIFLYLTNLLTTKVFVGVEVQLHALWNCCLTMLAISETT